MRIIKYKVDQQLLSTTDNLKDIYAGFENYLELEFEFDDNWQNCVKAIVFISGSDKKELPMLLKDNKCIVPKEAVQSRFIKFYLVGKRKPDYRIQTKQTRIGVIKNG